MISLFKRKKSEKPDKSSSNCNKEEVFIPVAARAEIYADYIQASLNIDNVDERITITVTPTISTVKLETQNITFCKILDGVWKQL